MLKRALQRLLRNRLLFALAVAVYLGLLGPFLISAPSTAAVLAGLVLLGLLVWWAKTLFYKPEDV